MRVGQYEDAIQANLRAVKVDQDYVRHCRAQGFYPGAYYPHNLHFLWWAQVFEGRSADALKTAKKIAEYAIENNCGPRKALEAPRFRHLPWLTLARFGAWDDLMKVPEPPATNDFLVDRALWHFTRGLALGARGNVDAAAEAQQKLAALAQSEEARKLNQPTFPVTDTLAVASEWLAGKVAGAKGDQQGMIQHLLKAVAAEDAMPYMEPSYWPFPARPALGAALLKSGNAVRAEQVFREDLQRWRRSAWGLLGLEQSLRTQGKNQSADLVRREFEESWKRADVKLSLDWF
jgi:tetratricopeptide (TPR) repeat protein